MKVIDVSIGILINESGEFLMEKNESNPAFKDMWQFPGEKLKKMNHLFKLYKENYMKNLRLI